MALLKGKTGLGDAVLYLCCISLYSVESRLSSRYLISTLEATKFKTDASLWHTTHTSCCTATSYSHGIKLTWWQCKSFLNSISITMHCYLN